MLKVFFFFFVGTEKSAAPTDRSTTITPTDGWAQCPSDGDMNGRTVVEEWVWLRNSFFFLTPNVFFSSSILEFIKDFMFCHACYLKRMKTNLILRNEGSMWIFLCWGVGREPTFPALCVRACVCVCHIIHAISQSFDLILAKAINATPIHLSRSNFC